MVFVTNRWIGISSQILREAEVPLGETDNKSYWVKPKVNVLMQLKSLRVKQKVLQLILKSH
jgi:hypothetical protein